MNLNVNTVQSVNTLVFHIELKKKKVAFQIWKQVNIPLIKQLTFF